MTWWLIVSGWAVSVVVVIAMLYRAVKKGEAEMEYDESLRLASNYEDEGTPPRAA